MRDPESVLQAAGVTPEMIKTINGLIDASACIVELRRMALERRLQEIVQEMQTAERENKDLQVEILAEEHQMMLNTRKRLLSPEGRAQMWMDAVREYIADKNIDWNEIDD